MRYRTTTIPAYFYEAPHEEITELLDDASEYFEATDRKTIQLRDL